MARASKRARAVGAAFSALLMLGGMYVPHHASAADQSYTYTSAARAVHLGIGKSHVVDLPVDAAEVLVADPKIANAVVRSARKAYVIGVSLGETDIIFFDASGNQIESLAVSVARDLSPIRNNISASIPGASVSARAVGESVMLTGSVRSAAEAQTAADIAANLVGSPDKVVNALSIENREQVMLKVSVVEMQRNIAKQFGINWDLQAITNGTSVGFGSNPSFINQAPGAVFKELAGTTNVEQNVDGNGLGVFHRWSRGQVLANLQALESNGLVRTLAEPTLMAISGEKAEFLAGGEFPIRTVDEDGRYSTDFKEYGVNLSFSPVVLSSGRISLQITTGVSELDATVGAVCCALKTRKTTTTVELPSGGSLSIAGLIQERNQQILQGLPGLINLPVLGSLFRSRDFQRGQTELVILVTPYIAKSNGRDKLARPDDGFSQPTDTETLLLGRLNRIYAPNRKPASGGYRGPVGHIVE